MVSPMRRIWQFSLLSGLAALVYLAFRNGTLDRASMSLFFDSGNPTDHWPADSEPWSRILYHAAPIITGAIATFSLSLILFPKRFRGFTDARMAGILLLVSTALGPGLLVNAVFKDNWGRPRPRETVDFGGTHSYVPAFVYNSKGNGKSFPCGHCSVGFVIAAPAVLLASRRARYALIGIATILGFSLGIARMAAGGHFLSDVLAAGLITFAGVWIATLILPIRSSRKDMSIPDASPAYSWWRRHPVLGSTIAITATIALGVGALFAVPFEKKHLFILFESSISPIPKGVSPNLAIQSNIEDLRTEVTSLPEGELFRLHGASRGFGTPGNRVAIQARVVSPLAGYHAGISLILEQSGQFTELSHDITILVPPHVNLQIEYRPDISLNTRKASPPQ